MTEIEWYGCQEPRELQEFLGPRASDRKFRLFAVACCRRLWDRIRPEGRAAVEAAERFADGAETPQRLRAALALARAAYDERRFGDLPVLADALEEAGCTDEAILAHCRGRGPHARGCWVLDQILDKS